MHAACELNVCYYVARAAGTSDKVFQVLSDVPEASLARVVMFVSL